MNDQEDFEVITAESHISTLRARHRQELAELLRRLGGRKMLYNRDVAIALAAATLAGVDVPAMFIKIRWRGIKRVDDAQNLFKNVITPVGAFGSGLSEPSIRPLFESLAAELETVGDEESYDEHSDILRMLFR